MHDYTLRNVPEDIHRAWKISAMMKSVTMREYVILALRIQVSKDLTVKEEVSDGELKRPVEGTA